MFVILYFLLFYPLLLLHSFILNFVFAVFILTILFNSFCVSIENFLFYFVTKHLCLLSAVFRFSDSVVRIWLLNFSYTSWITFLVLVISYGFCFSFELSYGVSAKSEGSEFKSWLIGRVTGWIWSESWCYSLLFYEIWWVQSRSLPFKSLSLISTLWCLIFLTKSTCDEIGVFSSQGFKVSLD